MPGGSEVTAEVGTVSDKVESIDTTTSVGPPKFSVNTWLLELGLDSVEGEENTNQ